MKARQVKRQGNAYSVAAGLGFPCLDTDGGYGRAGVWYSCFRRTWEKEGPRLYVGWDPKAGKWVTRKEG